MISIVICSVNQSLLANVVRNIAETIGVPFEIIAIDNTKEPKGICAVYNEAGAKARFPFLCFMHEDVSFETVHWGKMVMAHFADPRVGLIGVAGGDARSLVPSSWSIPIVSNEINLWQHYKFNEKPAERIQVTNSTILGNRKKVAALDGVWLCTRKEIFDRHRFDSTTFRGFHGYDIDFSLQISTQYDVCVVHDILLHHYSQGTPDKKWIDSARLISKKWRHQMPATANPCSTAQLRQHHWHSMQVFIQHLVRLKYPLASILQFYLTYSFTRFFTVRRFLSMGKYILSTIHDHPIRSTNQKVAGSKK